jgi:PAS domain S-box-containing protein
MLFDRSPIGMVRTTRSGTIEHANPAFVRLLGYESIDELLSCDINRDIYVDPGERERLFNRYLSIGVIDGAHVRWKRKDGAEVIVELWGHMVAGDDTRFDSWVLDVSELDAQRRDLQRSLTTLDLVMRHVPAIYWRVDAEMRILEVGGAMAEVLGYEGRGRYVGMTIAEWQAASPPSADAIDAHARALHGETHVLDSEYGGKMLSSRIGPLYDDKGKIVGAIGTAVDVTRVRQLERRMIDAQRAHSLGVLAGGLAHDFNNLLVAVIGSAELALRELPATTPVRAAVENIRDAGLRAAELTDQLLAYAGRGVAGTTRVLPAPLVAELLRIVHPTMPAGIDVHVDIPPELALRGDPAQVRQVMLNLIGNARDALGGTGQIAIAASAFAHDGREDADDVLHAPAGRYVLLVVSDDGPGMDAETRRHVFDPFFTTKSSGHGLGLAAALGIVRAHGGGIRVRSEPGRGARFEILWPSAGATVRPDSDPAVGARTVLVVDDEVLVRDVVAQMIRDLGYDAVTVADGAGAIDVVQHRAVDAVLVDLTMPGMSGAEVIRALREHRPQLPVVLCSGYDRDGKGPVKADAYLPKPFRIEALERTLAKLLPLRSV